MARRAVHRSIPARASTSQQHPRADLISPVRVAVLSRLAVLAWGILSAALGRPYDSSNELFIRHSPSAPGEWDGFINRWLAPFVSWDGVYFLHIADVGYTEEQFHAFFPGLPALMRLFTMYALQPLLSTGLIGFRSGLLLSGLIITFLSFVIATHLLHQIARTVLTSQRAAWLAAVVFALTPAGIFMTAIYTESLFAVTSFGGVLLCLHAAGERGRNVYGCLVGATLCFVAAAACRSNGVVLAGYLLCAGAAALQHQRKQGVEASLTWLFHWGFTALCALSVAAPYVMFQYYGYFRYCASPPAALQGYMFVTSLPEPPRPWCSAASSSWVPDMYGFVQQQYWGVGFLTYYRNIRIPDYILASPTLLLALWCSHTYYRQRLEALWVLFDLARALLPPFLLSGNTTRSPASSIDACSKKQASITQRANAASITGPQSIAPGVCASCDWHLDLVQPLLLHWLLLTLVGALFMYVQVLTRFVVGCPGLYCFLGAQLCSSHALSVGVGGASVSISRAHVAAVWFGYSVVFSVVGTAMFCNFYPWT